MNIYLLIVMIVMSVMILLGSFCAKTSSHLTPTPLPSALD